MLSRDRLLGRLVGMASKRAYRIAYDLLRNHAEAEDAVQDALTTVCKSHSSLRDQELAEAWFLRIVTTSCLRLLRRRRIKASFSLLLTLAPARVPANSGEELLCDSHEKRELVNHLLLLPTMQRSALLLRYGHELSIAAIASLMDIKPSTVKTHLVRGIRRLRTQILPRGK